MTDEWKSGWHQHEALDVCVLGVPLIMPNHVWEYSLHAARNSTDVDELLYPNQVRVPIDDSEAKAAGSPDIDDTGPAFVHSA